MTAPVRIAVLALQGDVREHAAILTSLGAEAVPVRRPEQLDGLDGLVIPGGESSVIDKLSRIFGVREPLRALIANGLPVYGTCAGLILLADEIEGAIDGQLTFGGLDVTVARNAFGGQVESFETELTVAGIDEPVDATFIRAPLITRVGPRATPIAALPDGGVVAVQQGNLLGTSFHPEMNGETRLHARFLELVAARRSAVAA
ncbi:pyridoxal 5'-phosphate synthase glutaminase subunit PdxT [Microbacterium sp. NPDC056052]|uniref:pyridoxal 5'-phosphate synthase glutaminase subunit PdxT n=1 Tax=Microbacterium sp. NPDC056052 TaxID=3345695 RepID=UPI0035D958AA